MQPTDQLSVVEIADRSGFSASALRFYERNGLISSVRTSGNQRRYGRSVLRRLAFIRAATNVGLTLEEVAAELATLPDGRTPTLADWTRLSKHWRSRLDDQIAALSRLRDGLDSCIGCGCLSLKTCAVSNPADSVRSRGPGAQFLPTALCRTAAPDSVTAVRLVIARCQVDYVGRLTSHLPLATRVLMVKADGSVLVHADGGSYKPLNWMSPPCRLEEADRLWRVVNKAGEELRIVLDEVVSDTTYDLGLDPGLTKDGVEAHLQELLADQPEVLGTGWRLVRREFPTAIGPVDLLCRTSDGSSVAVEIKRRGEIDGVEQLTRYLELLNRDPLIAPVTGVFAAQQIKPQARVLAADRGIRCVTLDYDLMRGVDDVDSRLF